MSIDSNNNLTPSQYLPPEGTMPSLGHEPLTETQFMSLTNELASTIDNFRKENNVYSLNSNGEVISPSNPPLPPPGQQQSQELVNGRGAINVSLAMITMFELASAIMLNQSLTDRKTRAQLMEMSRELGYSAADKTEESGKKNAEASRTQAIGQIGSGAASAGAAGYSLGKTTYSNMTDPNAKQLTQLQHDQKIAYQGADAKTPITLTQADAQKLGLPPSATTGTNRAGESTYDYSIGDVPADKRFQAWQMSSAESGRTAQINDLSKIVQNSQLLNSNNAQLMTSFIGGAGQIFEGAMKNMAADDSLAASMAQADGERTRADLSQVDSTKDYVSQDLQRNTQKLDALVDKVAQILSKYNSNAARISGGQ